MVLGFLLTDVSATITSSVADFRLLNVTVFVKHPVKFSSVIKSVESNICNFLRQTMADYTVITPDFVNVYISTSKDDLLFSEKRFPKNITVADLKVRPVRRKWLREKFIFQAKLELMTGASCQTMKIETYDKDNKLVCSLADDSALLGSFPIDDGMRLHVVDNFLIRNELDFGNVEKYEMPEESYSKRTDSVRNFLVKNKLGRTIKFLFHRQELLLCFRTV